MKKLTRQAPQEAGRAKNTRSRPYDVATVPSRWFEVTNLGGWALGGETSDQRHGRLLHCASCAHRYSTVDMLCLTGLIMYPLSKKIPVAYIVIPGSFWALFEN